MNAAAVVMLIAGVWLVCQTLVAKPSLITVMGL